MKNTFYRYIPFVFGGLIGWILFNPPQWMNSLGPLAWLVNGALCALVLISAVPLIISANLPEELKIESLAEADVPTELRALEQHLSGLGFRRADGPMVVHVAPTAHMIGFIHEKEPIYAAAFRTTTVPAKTACEFVSILHGDRGGLTTNADPGGAALPGGPGALRQVFPDGDSAALFRAHVEGLAYLRERGVAVRQLSASTFRQDFLESFRKQREIFKASPMRTSLVAFWRAATKRVPCLGPLRDQQHAQQQIAGLL